MSEVLETVVCLESKQIEALECVGRQLTQLIIHRTVDGTALQVGNHIVQYIRQRLAQFEKRPVITEHNAIEFVYRNAADLLMRQVVVEPLFVARLAGTVSASLSGCRQCRRGDADVFVYFV